MIGSFSVVKYRADDKQVWNALVADSPTATFLFNRDFMDYHADRFQDHSTLLFFENELVALLPATKKGDILCSHGGLTYGGIILKKDFFVPTPSQIATILNTFLHYYKNHGFNTLIYKEIPDFYTPPFFIKLSQQFKDLPSVSVVQEDIGAVIDLQQAIHFSYLRRRSIKKAGHWEFVLRISSNSQNQAMFSDFWNELLIPQLKNKYNLTPTHTLSEIILLANRFPENIKQYSIYFEGKIVAGVTIFEDKQVAHCQYIASNELGKKLYAADFLFGYLITEKYKHFSYFSFGISNEHGSTKINEGLLNWKKSWGAQACKQLHFKIDF
jgi:hypothetical protein